MHNFKLRLDTTDTVYVSKAGDDVNGTGTPSAPFKTIQKAIDNANLLNHIVIGTGVYEEDLNFNGRNAVRYVYGDGIVILRKTGGTVDNGLANTQYYDLIFESFSSINIGSNGSCLTERCTFIFQAGTTANLKGRSLTFKDCVFINTIFAAINAAPVEFARNIMVNSDFTTPGALKVNNNYIDATTKVNMQATTVAGFSCINNNLYNVNSANGFGIKIDIDPFRNHSELQAIGQNNNGCDLAPAFNNEILGDYTLTRTSPHLSRNIGPNWLRLASGFYLRGPEGVMTANSHYFENLATGEQFPIYQAENLTTSLQNGQLRMKVIEAVGGSLIGKYKVKLKISDIPVQLSYVDVMAGLNFNTDYPATENLFDPNIPEIFNNNVPNGYNWISGHAGRNPNRLDYSFRWSTKDNPDVAVATDWVTPELIFEWRTEPKYNPVTVKGNADPAFQPSPTDPNDSPKFVFVKFVDVVCSLENNYFSK
jgi:hypothetical protein